MNCRNTITPSDFICLHVLYACMFFSVYVTILFSPIFFLSYSRSLAALAVLVSLGLAAGIPATIHSRRTHTAILENLLPAYGSYYVLSRWNLERKLLITAAVIFLVLSALCSLPVYAAYRIKRNRAKLRRLLRLWMIRLRGLLACTLAAVFFLGGLRSALGQPEITSEPCSAAVQDTPELQTMLLQNREALLLLDADNWSTLDLSQRLQTTKLVSDIEAAYLGIPSTTVCTKPLEPGVMGKYVVQTNEITLNANLLASIDAYSALTAVCHETYHAYQHRLANLYNKLNPEDSELLLFSDAAQYQAEFANYQPGFFDYSAYENQRCEADSNAYARVAADRYFRFLAEQHLQNSD